MPEQKDHSFYQAETEGRTLFICHLFITTEEGAEDWRRTTIFRSMAKCRDRLCNLVIDGGSEMYVISQEVIDKLKLPTEKQSLLGE